MYETHEISILVAFIAITIWLLILTGLALMNLALHKIAKECLEDLEEFKADKIKNCRDL
tara:strand:- start:156 stop:332 length:177 start_codon:yes stop_codon:yes gene_type:complete